jgi:tripartite ATP-independent transporter DctP family solute receptor
MEEKMKKFLCIAVCVFVLAGGAFAGGGGEKSGSGKVLNMKLGHLSAIDHPLGIAAQQFADKVKARSNGGIVVEVYPNNELGNPPEVLEQNILGAIEMSLITQGALDKYSKKFAVVNMPFVFKDYDHAYRVMDGPFYDWVKNDLLAQGLVYIGSWDYGFRHMTNSVRPINSPADIKGLKFRTPGEIQLQSCMSALGANVQAIPFSELYLALKQGTVDGQENPLSVIYFNKYYEAQKYLAVTNHVYVSAALLVSKKVWESLPAEYQKIISEESSAAAAAVRSAIKNGDEDYIAKLQKEGMTVTRPNTTQFAAMMQPSYDAIAKYVGNNDYIPTFRKMVDSQK